MANITGRTVYILGAGASFHTGAPLLRDFLMKARFLKESNARLLNKEHFDKVFDWLGHMKGSSYWAEIDLENLEHVFSLLEMQSQLGISNAKEIYESLRIVTMETLDYSMLNVENNAIMPDATYGSFAEQVYRAIKERQNISYSETREFHSDVVMTFNYDCFFDFSLYSKGERYDYCLGDHKPYQFLPLLKLHGSMNWAKCSKCSHFTPLDPTPIAPGHMLPPFLSADNVRQFPFRMVTSVMKAYECPSCKAKDTYVPVIIAPTWAKHIHENGPITNVWKRAEEEISKASQIIFVGYSMPLTDTYFQYLLVSGLGKNNDLFRVIVISPSSDNKSYEELKSRYSNVFSRSILERGKLKFYANTFEGYVKSNLMVALTTKSEWPQIRSNI